MSLLKWWRAIDQQEVLMLPEECARTGHHLSQLGEELLEGITVDAVGQENPPNGLLTVSWKGRT